ncbi:MAG: 3D domain-containing protein [Bacilli bacterium]
MRNLTKALINRIFVVIMFISLLCVLAISNEKESIVTYNYNNIKSIQGVHIVNKYNNLAAQMKPVFVNNMQELKEIGPKKAATFVGTLTGYGPDCIGCNGYAACPPRQDVRNGNISFNDLEFGNIKIVAADKNIPCGTVVKISNYKYSFEPVIAIVLDRGGAIVGNTMDLLHESEQKTLIIGRQHNINFEIIRWGW